ncbi:hypothetical protein V3C99_016871 [Haemonchus contortus]|uniref:Secreted peptide n=1 Tax=Haemonchus contortus TaxID=6289 RepID=A0A7I4Z522_HAECO
MFLMMPMMFIVVMERMSDIMDKSMVVIVMMSRFLMMMMIIDDYGRWAMNNRRLTAVHRWRIRLIVAVWIPLVGHSVGR